MNKPNPQEHNPYFQKYISLVGDGNFLELLTKNAEETITFFKNIPSSKQTFSYAEKKWTVKEVLMHVIDTERVFAYRALVGAREDSEAVLPGMDENWYAAHVDVANRSMESLVEEFVAVRKSTEYVFKYMTEEQSKFMATAVSGKITPRALGYIIIGHVLHHNNVIKERYLK